MPYVFGNLDATARPYGPEDWAVSLQMQSYLLNFMRHGDPSSSRSRAWPKMRVGDNRVMTIGDTPGLSQAVSSPARLAALRAFAEKGGRLSLF